MGKRCGEGQGLLKEGFLTGGFSFGVPMHQGKIRLLGWKIRLIFQLRILLQKQGRLRVKSRL